MTRILTSQLRSDKTFMRFGRRFWTFFDIGRQETYCGSIIAFFFLCGHLFGQEIDAILDDMEQEKEKEARRDGYVLVLCIFCSRRTESLRADHRVTSFVSLLLCVSSV